MRTWMDAEEDGSWSVFDKDLKADGADCLLVDRERGIRLTVFHAHSKHTDEHLLCWCISSHSTTLAPRIPAHAARQACV